MQRTGSAGAAWLDIEPENRVLACQVITSHHISSHHVTSPRSPLALFNPETSILIQKRHPYTGNLNRETSGDSKNAFLHFADHTRYHIILHCITSHHAPDHTSHSMSLHDWHSFDTDVTMLRRHRFVGIYYAVIPFMALLRGC